VNQAAGVGSVIRPCARIVAALKTGSFQEAHRCNSRQEPDFHLQKYLIILICSILHVLIRCIKCIKDQQLHLTFIYMLLLSNGQQHVSVTHLARLTSW